MKTMQKIGAFALALLLVLSLGATAFAADEGANTNFNKTVTIEGLNDGETVYAYKLIGYDAEYNNYVITNDAFRAYLKTASGKGAAEDDELVRYYNGTSAGTLLDDFSGQTKLTAAGADVTAVASNKAAKLTFEPGYYMVLVSTTFASGRIYKPLTVFVKVEGDKSVVYGGAENDRQTGTYFDITYTAKSEQGPTLVKNVRTPSSGAWASTADAAVGETAEFVLRITVPKYTDVSKLNMTVTDVLTNLTYVADSAVVYTTLPMHQGTPTIDGAIAETKVDGKTITFELDYDKILGGIDETTRSIYVYYKATVDTAAAAADVHKATNTAKLTYANAATPDSTQDTAESSTTVYNYTFALNKYIYSDEHNFTTALDGAEFTLYSDEECQNPIDFVLDGDYYRPFVTGDDVSQKVQALPANNNFTIRGLDVGTYYVKETKTPKGYAAPAGVFRVNLVANIVEGMRTGELETAQGRSIMVAVNSDDDSLVGSTVPQSAKEMLSGHVANTTMPVLPSTGGMGTAIFTVGGVAVMVLAAVLLLFRRKKQEE